MQLLNELTDSNTRQNAFTSEDLYHDFKISRQEQLSKYNKMKQHYRTVLLCVAFQCGCTHLENIIKAFNPEHKIKYSLTQINYIVTCHIIVSSSNFQCIIT